MIKKHSPFIDERVAFPARSVISSRLVITLLDISAFMGNRKSGAFPLFPCALSVLSGVVCPGLSLFHHTPFAWRGEYGAQLRRHRAFR